jgi:hypothetical protein
MGYVEVRKLTPADKLTVCDSCEQEGLYASGKVIEDSYNEVVLWFCFNCVQKEIA